MFYWMELRKTFTVVYAKTAFSAYVGYIKEMPEKQAVDYSLDKVKKDLILELDKWKKQTGIDYRIVEIHK